MRYFLLVVLILFLVICSIEAQTTVAFDIERINRSTVLIMQTSTTGTSQRPVITCVSSGTLVSRDGLILTNAHATVQNADCPGNLLIIALSLRPGEPPVPTYQADVVQSDPGLDLALLRITRDFNGRLIETENLFLPFVELGDSGLVQLDDTVTVVGYPGLGVEPVSGVVATIVGYTEEPTGGWFKAGIRAGGEDIPGTMSGGGAYNRSGQLVAIPTTAPLTTDTPGATCQLVQDTNEDSLINQNDICVAVGGSINALRPSNFARPLLRSGSLGLRLEGLPSRSAAQSNTRPTFSRLFFAPSVTEGMPTTVVSRLPAGTTSLYLFFDYANMTPETVYELRVTVDGVINPIFSLAPVRWSGGERGMWYIGSSDQPWPNGAYEFTLFINGEITDSPKRAIIGGTSESEPAFSNVVFGIRDGNTIYGNGYVLGTGTIAHAQFIYNNMRAGQVWTGRWFFNGAEITRNPDNLEWTQPGNGSSSASIVSPNGLQPGRYRLELYIDDVLSATADFTIAGARQDALPRIFSNTRFVVADSIEEAIAARPVTSFTNRVDQLYALFDWERIAGDTLWRMRWSVDGTIFYDQLIPWNNPSDGQNFAVRLTGPNGVPDGTYRMELLINEREMERIEVQIGVGQLPIDPFAQPEGVLLRGQIIDADTRRGIPNVTFILISEEFSVSDFVWNEEQVYAMATTDRNGRFQLDRPLRYDAPYSVMIAADGYLPVPADGVEVTRETPNPLDMTIYLTRD